MRATTAVLLATCAARPAQAQIVDHGAHNSGIEAPAAGHEGHTRLSPDSKSIAVASPPAKPSDYAADAFYDPAVMARARAAMTKENGGMTFSQVMVDRFEYAATRGRDGYRWEGEGWIGGDINRLAVKSEGEGRIGGRIEAAEVQTLYSRAVDPWWNLIGGVRQEFGAKPRRTYGTIGIEGLAPYWFEVEAQIFLSNKGEAQFRLEGSYDQRITQRLILQPALEVNVAAHDTPELAIGSGVSDIEAGLRLRYEIVREFAPYIGVNWERKLGNSARYARANGDPASALRIVMGFRFWL